MKRTLVLLLSALFAALPHSSAWANVARAAGSVKTGTPVVGLPSAAPGARLGITPLSITPLSLSPSVSLSAPDLAPSMPVGLAVPAGVAVPAAAIMPSAVPSASHGTTLKAAVLVPAAAAAPDDAPISAAASLDGIGVQAASLQAGVAQASVGDIKTRAAFDVSPVRRADLSAAPVVSGLGVFGRSASRLAPVASAANDAPAPTGLPAPKAPSAFAQRWDRWTQRLTAFAAVPFLALQAPQIWANIGNLAAGHPEALANLPWIGYSTGILGNMLLLGYFVSQGEKSGARVQAIGVVTSAVVVVQIFLAGHMPLIALLAVMPAIVAGLAINLSRANYDYRSIYGPVTLPQKIAEWWPKWSKGLSLLGLAVLPQVLWTTFAPAAWASFLPAIIAGALGLTLSHLDSKKKLPAGVKRVWDKLGGWTATLLFMYGPIAQLMANVGNPVGMAGIAIGTLFLAMAGNLLMLPRAMHTKDVIWFTGSAWGVVMGGWAVLLTMTMAGFAAPWLFWAATAAIPAWLAAAYLLSRLSRK